MASVRDEETDVVWINPDLAEFFNLHRLYHWELEINNSKFCKCYKCDVCESNDERLFPNVLQTKLIIFMYSHEIWPTCPFGLSGIMSCITSLNAVIGPLEHWME